ncbi:hypothetical protein [Streptomyces sp. NPDC014344]|uniref:hypothetical protein n=1 Tax=Streptomyces sp. NPDC014344 TaxID=3364871 RepID=UPI003701BDE0
MPPDPDPVEDIWSVLRRTATANRAFADPDDLTTAVRRGLRRLSRTAPTSSTAAPPARASNASHQDDTTP